MGGGTSPLVVTPQPATVTDRSGTAGVSASVLCAANASRRGLLVQNLSTGNIYFNVTGVATAGSGSIVLIPNAYWESNNGSAGTGAVSIIGVSAGQAYTAKEW